MRAVQVIPFMTKTMLALGAAPLALLPLAAHADEAAADAITILVVGQHESAISIEPRGLSVSLGEEQFAGINAQNVEDLMKYAPDFFVRKRYAGDSNGVPGFRGTHSTQSARTLVMVDGHKQMAEVHDRMPLILAREDWQAWTGSPTETALAMCRTWPGELDVDRTTERWAGGSKLAVQDRLF